MIFGQVSLFLGLFEIFKVISDYKKWKVLDLRWTDTDIRKLFSKEDSVEMLFMQFVPVKIRKPKKRGPKFILGKGDKLRKNKCIACLIDLKENADCRKIVLQ